MKAGAWSAALMLALLSTPLAAQTDAPVAAGTPAVDVGSIVRIEYRRYFAGRREIVDSADATRANRWRQHEVRGRVEELSETHVRLRAHDRTYSVQRWQIDRAWLYVHSEESDHAGESLSEWGLGGIVTAALLGGLLLATSCNDGDDGYCGLTVLLLMTGVAGLGVIAGIADMVDDAEQDFVEVPL